MNWIKHAVQGKEPLWKVFWVYGALGTIAVKLLFILIFTIIGVHLPWGNPTFTPIWVHPAWGIPTSFVFSYIVLGVGAVLGGFPPSTLGTIVVLVYTSWFLIAEWRCAFNVKEKIWGYIVRGHVILTVMALVIGAILVTQDLVITANKRYVAIAALQAGGRWEAASTPVQQNDGLGFMPIEAPQSDGITITFKMLTTNMMTIPLDLIELSLLVLLLWRYRKWSSLIIAGVIAEGTLEFLLYHINSVLNTPANLTMDFAAFMIDLCALKGLQKVFITMWQMRTLRTRAQRIAILSLGAALLLLIGQLVIFAHYYWGNDFWRDISVCLSLQHHGNCYTYFILSRSLMYFSFIWIIASLICLFWWRHIISIKRWVETGAYDQ